MNSFGRALCAPFRDGGLANRNIACELRLVVRCRPLVGSRVIRLLRELNNVTACRRQPLTQIRLVAKLLPHCATTVMTAGPGLPAPAWTQCASTFLGTELSL